MSNKDQTYTCVPMIDSNGVGLELTYIDASGLVQKVNQFRALYGVRPVIYVKGLLSDGDLTDAKVSLREWTKAVMASASNGYSMAVMVNGDVVEVGPAKYEVGYEDAQYRWPAVRLLIALPAKEGGKG